MVALFTERMHQASQRLLTSYDIGGCYRNANSDGISWSFGIVKSFQIVGNDKSSEIHVINAGQGSPIGPILFLLFINDPARNILRLLETNYADDTTVQRRTSKIRDSRSFVADHPPHIALTAPWVKNCLVTLIP